VRSGELRLARIQPLYRADDYVLILAGILAQGRRRGARTASKSWLCRQDFSSAS